jgi:hypothetical protein
VVGSLAVDIGLAERGSRRPVDSRLLAEVDSRLLVEVDSRLLAEVDSHLAAAVVLLLEESLAAAVLLRSDRCLVQNYNQ